MLKYQIGADIQKIEDFVSPKRNFLNKIFTPKEIAYCLSKSRPAQHFAARFAAKEAVIKALSQFNEKITYKQIETLISYKKPKINIKTLKKSFSIRLSLSHSGDYAIAFVLARKNGREKNI